MKDLMWCQLMQNNYMNVMQEKNLMAKNEKSDMMQGKNSCQRIKGLMWCRETVNAEKKNLMWFRNTYAKEKKSDMMQGKTHAEEWNILCNVDKLMPKNKKHDVIDAGK